VAQRYTDINDDVKTSAPLNEEQASTLGSGLVVDLDRHTVRAVLFDTVGGHGRFVTSGELPSTLLPPIADGASAVRDVIRMLEAQSGMTFLGDHHGIETPRDGHSGVDFVALTGMPAEPVRLAVIPIGGEALTSQLVAAARRTPCVVDLLNQDVRTEDGVLSGARLESAIRQFRPDAVLIVDGDKAQSEWATAVGTLSSLSAEGAISQIIIVARDQYQQQAAQTMGEDADLRGIDPGEFEAADIAAAIELELHTLAESRFQPGEFVQASSPVSYTSRVRAGDLVTKFLARRRDQTVTAVSIGDGVLIHSATPDASLIAMRPDMDVHSGIRSVLRTDPREILALLPFGISEEEIHHWILNRSLRPASVSSSWKDRLIESAVATVVLRSAWTDVAQDSYQHHDLIIGGRLMAAWDSPELALLCLLNAIQPRPSGGVVEVDLDVDGMLYAAGAVGELSPALAADVVERDLLMPLASVIVVQSDGAEGDLAVRGEIALESGQSQQFSVPAGSIHRLELRADESAVVTLHCESNASIGSSECGATVVIGDQIRLRGGDLGVVIDARGRSASAGMDLQNQPARVSNWLGDLGAKEISH
jgi:hypothetical protein